ncbi:MAG: tetratricopeptide repeat protein [Terriglobia bacterium]
MAQSRLTFLQDALNKNPDDTFARYALAMELANGASAEAAWEHFEYLLTRHPDYAATYYQAGMLLWKLGRREEARKVLSQGIEVTRRQGKSHAESELQRALEELGSEIKQDGG